MELNAEEMRAYTVRLATGADIGRRMKDDGELEGEWMKKCGFEPPKRNSR